MLVGAFLLVSQFAFDPAKDGLRNAGDPAFPYRQNDDRDGQSDNDLPKVCEPSRNKEFQMDEAECANDRTDDRIDASNDC